MQEKRRHFDRMGLN